MLFFARRTRRLSQNLAGAGPHRNCGTRLFCPQNPQTFAELSPRRSTPELRNTPFFARRTPRLSQNLAGAGPHRSCGARLFCPQNPQTFAELSPRRSARSAGHTFCPPVPQNLAGTDRTNLRKSARSAGHIFARRSRRTWPAQTEPICAGPRGLRDILFARRSRRTWPAQTEPICAGPRGPRDILFARRSRRTWPAQTEPICAGPQGPRDIFLPAGFIRSSLPVIDYSRVLALGSLFFALFYPAGFCRTRPVQTYIGFAGHIFSPVGKP